MCRKDLEFLLLLRVNELIIWRKESVEGRMKK